jgi:cell division protein FtsL
MKISFFTFYIFCFCLALLSGVGMFVLKYEVIRQEEELAFIKKDIQKQQSEIHILKAEWSYLTSPERLKKLNEQVTHLKPMKTGQILSLKELPKSTQTPISFVSYKRKEAWKKEKRP